MLANKTFVITGGSKGLGLTCVQNLLHRKATVFVLSRTIGQLDTLLASHPKQLHWLATDIADASSVSHAFAQIKRLSSHIDALILNAALATPKKLADLSPDDVQQSLSVNISGPIFCMQQAAPLLSNGRIIFISSESVQSPFPMLSLYACVKAGVEKLFEGLRAELLEDHQIKLTVLRAGSMADTSFGESWSAETLETFYNVATASGKLAGSGTPMQTQSVSDAILFILNLTRDANINTMDLRSADAL